MTQTRELVRFVTIEGKPTSETYLQDPAGPDRLGHIRLFNVDESEYRKVHRQRIIPAESQHHAIGIGIGDKVRVICPVVGCLHPITLVQERAVCPEHGTYEILLQGARPQDLANTKPGRQIKQKPRKERTVSETKEAPVLDINKVAEYGELYAKAAPFDHVKIELRCYVLLADGPPRKLTFNTYNGVLSHKSRDPLAELKLEAFKTNDNASCDKKIIQLGKGLDHERKALLKKLYAKVE